MIDCDDFGVVLGVVAIVFTIVGYYLAQLDKRP